MEDTEKIMENIELVEFVTKSDERLSMFLDLYPDASRDYLKSEGYADSSVTRFNSEWEDKGLVTIQGWEYSLTAAGKVFAQRLEGLSESAAAAKRLAPFFCELSPDPGDDLVDVLDLLGEAEIYQETGSDAGPPWEEYRDLIRGSDVVRELVPWSTELAWLFREEVENNGLEAEFVVDPEIKDIFCDGRTRRNAERMIETGNVNYYTSATKLPNFTLSLFDDEIVTLGARSDSFVLLKSDSRQLRNWGEEIYQEYNDGSTPLFLHDA